MNATKNETTKVANVETETTEKLDALYEKVRHCEAMADGWLLKPEALLDLPDDEFDEEYCDAVAVFETAFDAYCGWMFEALKARMEIVLEKHSERIATTETETETTTETTETEPTTETIDHKTAQRRAARAVGRENKAKYARWEKEAKKKLPVFDRPNHIIAYNYYDENGVLLGRKPVSK